MKKMFLTLILLSTLQSHGENSYLRRFTGQWTGEYIVTNLARTEIKSTKIEQRYTWKNDRLYGETAFRKSGNRIQKEYAVVVTDGSVLKGASKSNGQTRNYTGYVRHHEI